MSDLTPGWMGDERRRADPRVEVAAKKIDDAMADVRHLYGAVEELAVAVSKSVPRDEIEAREKEHVERQRQFREQAKLIIIGFAVLFLFIITYSVFTVGGLNRRIDAGHQVIHTDDEVLLCVMKLPDGSRTDAAVLSCRQVAQVKGVP